jgi:hypothetical protein
MVNDFMGRCVPVSDYALESFARNVLETFLFTVMNLDPQMDLEQI